MAIFFSADYHLGHDNVIKYCSRPFRDGKHMNNSIIRNHNQRIKECDIMYHIGDFCFRGGVQGGPNKVQFWESQLNGKIIHVIGNHDPNNGVKERITSCTMVFGKRRFFVVHRPPEDWNLVPENIDGIICGHVHRKWDYQVFDCNGERNPIPMINVGIDVRNYFPIRLDEVIRITDRLAGLSI